MQLNKDQKEALKSLTEHRGFKILEEIVEDKRQSLYGKFERANLLDPKDIHGLQQAQSITSGMTYLVDTAKAKTEGVIKAPDMS